MLKCCICISCFGSLLLYHYHHYSLLLNPWLL